MTTTTVSEIQPANDAHAAKAEEFNRIQQALELVDAVGRTLFNSHNLVVIQLLNNADQLQSQLSSGNFTPSEIKLLVENLIKRPLRRAAGLIAVADKTNQEVYQKLKSSTGA